MSDKYEYPELAEAPITTPVRPASCAEVEQREASLQKLVGRMPTGFAEQRRELALIARIRLLEEIVRYQAGHLTHDDECPCGLDDLERRLAEIDTPGAARNPSTANHP